MPPATWSGLTVEQNILLGLIADDETNLMSHTACMYLEYWGGLSCEHILESAEDAEPRSLKLKQPSVAASEIKTITAYPNPAAESIKISTLIPPDCRSLVLNIYDVNGRLVADYNMLNSHGMIEQDCSKWQAGTYLLELIGDKIKLGTTSVIVVHNN